MFLGIGIVLALLWLGGFLVARWLPYVPYGGLPDPYLAHTRGDLNRISFPARKCAYRIKEHAPAEDPRHIKPWVFYLGRGLTVVLCIS